MTTKRVIRTQSYRDDLVAIEAYIERENPGTHELVAHENYVVIMQEDAESVTVLNVVHARQQYP
jgi:toxin ParE1/3/4